MRQVRSTSTLTFWGSCLKLLMQSSLSLCRETLRYSCFCSLHFFYILTKIWIICCFFFFFVSISGGLRSSPQAGNICSIQKPSLILWTSGEHLYSKKFSFGFFSKTLKVALLTLTLVQVIDYFNSRMEDVVKTGDLSVEKVLEVILENGRTWRGDNLKVLCIYNLCFKFLKWHLS